MTVVPTIESLQDSVNELRNAILEIKERLTEFMVSQNAISNELNRMKNGEGTSNNGGSQNHSGNGNQNHRNGDRGFGRMSKTEFSRFNGDDVKGWHIVLDDPLIELKKLKQDGTVKDYQEKFKELLNMVELDKKHAISLFLEGLKNEISLQIRMFTLESLTTLIALKSRYTPLLPNLVSKLYSNTTQRYRNASGIVKPNTNSGGGYQKPNTPQVRKPLSQKEYAEKRLKICAFIVIKSKCLGTSVQDNFFHW
ncbi:reverse transcriptase [Tanacetum coccineum]